MRQKIQTAFAVFATGFLSLSSVVFAQSTNDVLVYDNQTDFLLPSYFDSPAPAVPDATPAPAQAQTINQPLVPQNVPSDVDILQEIFGDQATVASNSGDPAPATTPAKKATTQVFYPTPKSVKQVTTKPLLTPLAPLPKLPEKAVPATKRTQFPSTYASKLLAKETGKSKSNITLPKDIRLQFPSSSTQITDSAVKWISAYALHVQRDPMLLLTIRVSNRDWAVQQARLGLILQISMEKGLSSRQIQIFQSDRDPNTVIIGAEENPHQTHAITSEDVKRVTKEQKVLSW